MALVLTVIAFTALVAGAVYFVVRTALKARITEDGDIPDPLDSYVQIARSSISETREGVAKVVRRGAEFSISERRA